MFSELMESDAVVLPGANDVVLENGWPKLHIWMNYPSHHQMGLFENLLSLGVNLKVTYYDKVSPDRVALGWKSGNTLKPWEASLEELNVSPEKRVQQLADYIHIIPGYSSSVTRRIVAYACKSQINWCHWSEPARPGWRWWVRYATKRAYARKVNKFALGALSQGKMAQIDFIRWGIRSEKIAHLTYSISSQDEAGVVADERMVRFARGRGVFLFLGQLIDRKAIDVLLRAYGRLDSDRWCLVVVGNGNAKKYQGMAGKLKLNNSVLFLPAMPWNGVAPIYKAADVLILPSRFDGWGVVVNEAAARSKALIVSTSCGSAWHFVEPGINGYMVTPGSVDSLSDAMRRYVKSGRELAIAQGLESRRISLSYGCDVSASKLLQILSGWLPLEQPEL